MIIDHFLGIDISPVISGTSPVFPGDQPFDRKVALDFSHGDHLTLSSITTTVHVGAHADAPVHYHQRGESIDKRALSYYVGRCQVVSMEHVGSGQITVADFSDVNVTSPRLLIKTGSFPHQGPWTNDFASISADAVRHLSKLGVITIGIDTPSVDPADSKDLQAHKAIYNANMAVLEGLDLERVTPAEYKLIALPLKIKDGDASPVRAVLIPA